MRGKPAGGSFGFLQERRFSYDGRGFLLSEQHPEKGAFGNVVVRYREYDALGHAGEAEDGETLTFAYDRAERLSTIRWKRSPTTTVPLKAFREKCWLFLATDVGDAAFFAARRSGTVLELTLSEDAVKRLTAADPRLGPIAPGKRVRFSEQEFVIPEGAFDLFHDLLEIGAITVQQARSF